MSYTQDDILSQLGIGGARAKKKASKKKTTKKKGKTTKKAPARKKTSRAPARKTTKKAKVRRPSSTPKACSVKEIDPSEWGSTWCTSRSPGGIPDPKVSKALIAAALKDVMSLGPKRAPVIENRSQAYPKDGDYLTVAYGGGADSTAILIGLDQLWRKTHDKRWIPRVISMADTGGEFPHTYDFVQNVMEPWLEREAFQGAPAGWRILSKNGRQIVKCVYSTLHYGGGWGTGYSLETQMLVNQSLPSISFSQHSCSTKFKIDAQQRWFAARLGKKGGPPKPRGRKRIVRAIGYDATEEKRLKGHSTYSGKDEEKTDAGKDKGIYRTWYPLMAWGWDRARCLAEAKAVFGRTSTKSSCFFCGAMRGNELVLLAKYYPDLMERAVFMEQVALAGRHKPHGGLNPGGWLWTDFFTGNVNKISPVYAAHVVGGVLSQKKNGDSMVVPGSLGTKRKPRNLAPGHTYIPPAGFVMMTTGTAKRLTRDAKAWVAASPDKGIQVPGWRKLRRKEKLEDFAKTRKKRNPDGTVKKTKKGNVVMEVWAMVPNSAMKGLLDKDMAVHPLTRKIPAFKNMLGWRCTPEHDLDWNDLLDGHWPKQVAKTEKKGNSKAARKARKVGKISMDKIEVIDAQARAGCYRKASNPRRLPMAQAPEDPMITGF
jgi:hypothetical protein